MAGLVRRGARPRARRRAGRAREGRRAPAARCCSRAAWSGATARSRSSARSARAATSGCSGSSSSGSTTRSSGSSRWAHRCSSARPATRSRSGVRFDTAGLTRRARPGSGRGPARRALAATAEPLVLATGGFQGDPELVARTPAGRSLRVRANPWSEGDGLELALERGAALSAGLDEFYGAQHGRRRVRRRSEFVSLAQLYGRYALDATTTRARSSSTATTSRGRRSTSSRRPRASRARAPGTSSTTRRCGERVRYGTVRELVARHATRTEPAELPFAPPPQAVVAVARRGRDHAHDRRSPHRRARARPGRARRPIDGLLRRRAPTRAGSRRAATRAASPRRSCSA